MPGQETGRDSPFRSGPVSYFNLELESGAKAHFVGRFDAALKGRSSTLDAVVEVSLGFAIAGQPMAAVPKCSVLVLGILSAIGGSGRRWSWGVASVTRQGAGRRA